MVDSNARAKLVRRAEIVKALAHPSRLLILEGLLRHDERCVCDLTKLVGADMSAVSRHLGVLRVAGLVAEQRRGQQVFYRLRSPAVQSLVRASEDMAGAITREAIGQLMKMC